MTIIYHIGDLGFSADSPDKLKKELEEYFSYKGLVPGIEIIQDYVRVDIDDDKIKTAEAKVKLAFDCCNRGNFSSAKEFITGALEICPLYSDAHRTLAQIYMQEGKQEEAVASCAEALKCDPKNMWALILMGNLMLHFRKDNEEALKYYERVLYYYPDNVLALNNVAGVKLAMSRFDEALVLFDKVIGKEPSYAGAHYGKAACLDHMGRTADAFEAARVGCLQGKDTPENPGVRRELTKMIVSLARKIAERTDYMVEAEAIKEEIEKEYGTPVELRSDSTLPVLGKLRYARHHGLDKSVVLYRPGDPFTWHYVIHELMHLAYDSENTRAGVGKVVYSDTESDKRFYGRFAAFFRPLRSRLGEERFKAFYGNLHAGLCSRAMNSPLDLFVEDRIFEKYPRVRPLQLLSLLQQEMDNMKADENAAGSKEIPKVIVDASRVMNQIQCLQLKSLYGVDMMEGHHPTRQEASLADSLFKEYLAYKDTFRVGDEYELMEYFTQELRLQDLLIIGDEPTQGGGIPGDALDLEAMMALTPEEKQKEEAFQAANRDGEDPGRTMMMALFMVAALDYMEGKPKAEVKQIAYDAAMLGVGGISPDKSGYFLPSVPGKTFGGNELLAWYYVSWALAVPDMLDQLNLPFSSAYAMALSMREAKKKGGKS